MTDESIIEAIEAAKHDAPNHPRGIGFNEGLDTAIALSRQHQSAPKQYFTSGGEFITEVQLTMGQVDAVERVAKAISQWMNCQKLPIPPHWERLQESTRQAYREQAKAAIAAIHDYAGESSDREAGGGELLRNSPAPTTHQSVNHTDELARLNAVLGFKHVEKDQVLAEFPAMLRLLNAQAGEIARLKHDIEQSLAANAELATRPKEEESIREAVGREWLETKES